MQEQAMLDTWSPRLLSILRVVAALLYIWHGSAKMFGVPAAAGAPVVPFDLITLRGISAVLEVFGGGLLLIGLFSRPVAFILSGHMAFAYFIGHAAQNLWPILNRGELTIMFCFVFLYIAAAGPGPWSLDAAMRRGRSPDAGDFSR